MTIYVLIKLVFISAELLSVSVSKVHQTPSVQVDRKIRSLGPRSIIPPVPASERSFVHELAYKVILEQQANSAVFPCSVLAAVLLYKVQNKAWKVSIYKVFYLLQIYVY